MPQILEFSFKNVCSYGNKTQNIPFGAQPQLMLIVGENGAGKTTIGNALEFSWYGKTRRRRIKELSNRLNGHLETYNKFIADDGRIVEIARGIDPSHFDLKVDGVPDNKAGKTKIDEYIENELLGMSFDVCTNTMILSINDFKSFVKIKAEDKRKIVDRIFGMDVLNKMNVILKDDLRIAKEDMARAQSIIESQKLILQQSESQLVELKANLSTEAEKRKIELEGLITALETDIRNNTAAASNLELDVTALVNEMTGKLEEVQNEYVNADNDAISRSVQAEAACDQEIARECESIDLLMKSVLDDFDAQYGETIGKLTTEANSAADELKRDLDAKLTEVNNKYIKIDESLEKAMNDAIDKAEADHDAKKQVIDNTYREITKSINIEIDRINTEYGIINSEIEKHKGEQIALNLGNETCRRKIALYEMNKCPECDGDLTTHEHVNRKAELEEMLRQGIDNLQKCEANIGDKRKKLDDLAAANARAGKESADNDSEYFKMLSEASNELTDAKNKINTAYGNTKYNTLQNKNIEISAINKEYSDATADIVLKLDQVKNLKHERDMKKEQSRSEYGMMKANVRDNNWKILNEKKTAINTAKEIIVKNLSNKSAEINKTYGDMIFEKRQAVAVMRQKIQGAVAQSNLHKRDLEEVQAKLADNVSVKSLEQVVETARDNMLSMLADETDANNRIKLCLATQELLLEDGIKKKFMGLVLPAMNTTIKRIIDELQYKFGFHFDEDFNAVIEHMGHDVSPESLSTGEEKMIDLIVVLAVMELIKMKHPKVNVMFLDEVFASLDQNNIEKVIKILREFMNKYCMTLFAISHTMMPKEYFDKVISVTNDGMFSDLVVN